MQRFDGVDFLEIDASSTRKRLAVRGLAREFVTERLMPVIQKHIRPAPSPWISSPRWRAGVLRAPTSRATAAPGSTTFAYGLIIAGAGARRQRLRSFVSVQGALCMFPILAYALTREEQVPPEMPRHGDRLLRLPRRLRSIPPACAPWPARTGIPTSSTEAKM